MHVDRAGVRGAVGAGRRRRCRPPGRSPPRPAAPATPPDDRMSARSLARRRVGPEPAARPAPQQPGVGQGVDGVGGGRPEQRQVGLRQRGLLGRGAQVRPEDVLVGRVEDGRPRPAARTAPRDGARGRCPAGRRGRPGRRARPARRRPARPTCCHRAARVPGKPAIRHGVEPADVDAELEGVGRRQPEQVAAPQRCLEGPPLLGQVAAAVRRHPAGQRRVDLGEQAARCIATCSAPRRERTNARVRTPSATRSASRSAVSEDGGAPHRGAVLAGERGERRLPQRERDPPAGRGVLGDGEHVEPGQPAGGDLGVGHGGRGEHERR